MSTTVDFYFDFGSPTAFLAYKRLKQLEQQYDLNINYVPMLLGGVFKATDNQSPAFIPAKGAYMNQHDLPRFMKRYDVELEFNPFFPINTLQLMRAAIAAQRSGCFAEYVETVYNAMWQKQLNMGDPEIAAQCLTDAGLDAEALLTLNQDPEVKQQLIENTEQAVARGAFGAPTMYFGDVMFFGLDRLYFIEERLQEAG